MIELKNITMSFKVKKRRKPFFGRTFFDLFFPKYEEFNALNNFSLTIKSGEIIGILGPNGAGKTTLMSILCGLIKPTKGEVKIDNLPPEKQKHRFGVVLGQSLIYNRLTGYANLEYYAKLYGCKNIETRINNITKLLKLEDWLDEYVEHYSNGMKAKLAIARALLHDPDIIILDEPTLGLDVFVSEEIRKLIKNLHKKNKTILLATHYIEEAKELCERIVLIDKGKIIKIIDDVKKTNIKKEIFHELK